MGFKSFARGAKLAKPRRLAGGRTVSRSWTEPCRSVSTESAAPVAGGTRIASGARVTKPGRGGAGTSSGGCCERQSPVVCSVGCKSFARGARCLKPRRRDGGGCIEGKSSSSVWGCVVPGERSITLRRRGVPCAVRRAAAGGVAGAGGGGTSWVVCGKSTAAGGWPDAEGGGCLPRSRRRANVACGRWVAAA